MYRRNAVAEEADEPDVLEMLRGGGALGGDGCRERDDQDGMHVVPEKKKANRVRLAWGRRRL